MYCQICQKKVEDEKLKCNRISLEHGAGSSVNSAICEEISTFCEEPSLGIVENFKRSSAVHNVKYNCAILFWKDLY